MVSECCWKVLIDQRMVKSLEMLIVEMGYGCLRYLNTAIVVVKWICLNCLNTLNVVV